jgi:hypothetical protein
MNNIRQILLVISFLPKIVGAASGALPISVSPASSVSATTPSPCACTTPPPPAMLERYINSRKKHPGANKDLRRLQHAERVHTARATGAQEHRKTQELMELFEVAKNHDLSPAERVAREELLKETAAIRATASTFLDHDDDDKYFRGRGPVDFSGDMED